MLSQWSVAGWRPQAPSIRPWCSFAQEKHPWGEICRIREAAMGLLQRTLGMQRVTPQKWITRELSALVTWPLQPRQAAYAAAAESWCKT